jgi:hypothetical protein
MNVIHSDPVCFFEHGFGMDFQTPSLALAWNSRGLRLLWYGFPDVFVSFGMEFQTPSSASLDFLTPSSALRKKR